MLDKNDDQKQEGEERNPFILHLTVQVERNVRAGTQDSNCYRGNGGILLEGLLLMIC